ncbi:hypothetical protein [uncultured Hymenobacter sp.]|uniref:hypothetical protein n=1 Tax=uncultured Hymenobacter sp. TaxID=170016 RepID=UPI0035CBDA6A
MSKKLLLLGLGLVGFCTAARAQRNGAEVMPFRKANAVLLFTRMAPDSVLRLLANNLRERGFETAEFNPSAGYFLTKPSIEAGGKGWPLTIRVAHMTGGVVLTGRYLMPEFIGNPEFPAEFLGFEWSPAKNSFRQLEKTARLFGGGEVRFSRWQK